MTRSSEVAPRRWDLVVRATHWLVAGAVLTNSLITEEGSDWHIWVGYGLAAVLLVRFLWGIIGPQEARFSAFPPSPRRAIHYISLIMDGRVGRHRSHNPLGALMVYALWATLIVIIASGVAMAGSPLEPQATQRQAAEGAMTPRSTILPGGHSQIEDDGDEEAHEPDDQDENLKGDDKDDHEEGVISEIHEAAVTFLYGLILLHLAGVAFETRRAGRQIIMAMLPKRR